jgi:hypothetical protein
MRRGAVASKDIEQRNSSRTQLCQSEVRKNLSDTNALVNHKNLLAVHSFHHTSTSSNASDSRCFLWGQLRWSTAKASWTHRQRNQFCRFVQPKLKRLLRSVIHKHTDGLQEFPLPSPGITNSCNESSTPSSTRLAELCPQLSGPADPRHPKTARRPSSARRSRCSDLGG